MRPTSGNALSLERLVAATCGYDNAAYDAADIAWIRQETRIYQTRNGARVKFKPTRHGRKIAAYRLNK